MYCRALYKPRIAYGLLKYMVIIKRSRVRSNDAHNVKG